MKYGIFTADAFSPSDSLESNGFEVTCFQDIVKDVAKEYRTQTGEVDAPSTEIKFLIKILHCNENPIDFLDRYEKECGQCDKEYSGLPIAVLHEKLPATYGYNFEKMEFLLEGYIHAYGDARRMEIHPVWQDKFRFKFIECPDCGSQLAAKRLKTNTCPVCDCDIRPDWAVKEFQFACDALKKCERDLVAEYKQYKGHVNNAHCNLEWVIRFPYSQKEDKT